VLIQAVNFPQEPFVPVSPDGAPAAFPDSKGGFLSRAFPYNVKPHAAGFGAVARTEDPPYSAFPETLFPGEFKQTILLQALILLYTARRARFFRRLRLRIFLPALVDMRLRNPCSLFLLLFDG
jgi:hypothetical protein